MFDPAGCPPQHYTPVPDLAYLSGGDVVADWAEENLVQFTDSAGGRGGDPFVLREWQREILRYITAEWKDEDGSPESWSEIIVMLPRKNGKTALIAMLVLHEFVFGPIGGEILIAAADRKQAGRLLRYIVRMIKMCPELDALSSIKVNSHTIENKQTGTIIEACSRDAYRIDGTSPSLAVLDEAWNQPDSEMWDALSLGTGARPGGKIIGISTAGPRTDRFGNDSLLYAKYQYGLRVESGEVVDPRYGFLCWQAPADAPWDDPATWAACNPGYGDILLANDFLSKAKQTTDRPGFETKKLNRFVAHTAAALREGVFEALGDKGRHPEPGTEIVIGVDGSRTNDSTAAVGCTLDGHLFVLHLQEKQPTDSDEWRVSQPDLAAALREACETYKVREIAYDPLFLQALMQDLEREGMTVMEWPTGSMVRMIPAWKHFADDVYESFTATDDRHLSHSGDPALERHARNTFLLQTTKGALPVKEAKNSVRKIDLLICAVIAYDRATHYRHSGPRYGYEIYG